MTLSTILSDTAALLNDQTYSFMSKDQLTRWVNEARRMTARRTGCVRRLVTGQAAFGASAQPGFMVPGATQPGALPDAFPQAGSTGAGDFSSDFSSDFSTSPASLTTSGVQNSMMTIPGVERYPYGGFFNPYLRSQHQGCSRILDVVTVAISQGGTARPVLNWMPWEDFQAYCRSYALLNSSYPAVWSVMNDGEQGEIWLFPVPSQANEIELDVFASPQDLLSDNDFDVIPEGMRDALKFGAASLVYLSTGRFMQAQVMEDMFSGELGITRVAYDRGKAPSFYWNTP